MKFRIKTALPHSSLKTEDGMTLIELVVAISIMGIITAIVVPLWSSYARKQDIKTQAERLADTLRKARSMAMNSEKGELVGDEDIDVIGYYVYLPGIIEKQTSPAGGAEEYILYRLERDPDTLDYTKTMIETVAITDKIKLYYDSEMDPPTESILFTLPFGRTQFYTDEPDSGTLVTEEDDICSNNSDACAVYYAQRDSKSDYYYRIEITQEGIVLTESESD